MKNLMKNHLKKIVFFIFTILLCLQGAPVVTYASTTVSADVQIRSLSADNYFSRETALFSSLISSRAATPINVYIDGTGTIGNDANNGLTPDSPVSSLSKAYELLKNTGGTIYIVDTVSVSGTVSLSNISYSDNTKTISLVSGTSVAIKRYAKETDSNYTADSNINSLFEVQSGATLTLTNITIDGNRDNIDAKNTLINIFEGGTVYLTKASLQNNKNTAWVPGGAVSNKGSLIITDSIITNNYSDHCGAGIYNTGTLTVKGSNNSQTVISNNESDYNGGGIFTAGVTEFEGPVLIDSNMGGGIHSEYDLVLPAGIEISNNESSSGAGVYITEEKNLTINGALIHDNFSKYKGSGICVGHHCVLTINSGEIYNNGYKDTNIGRTGGGIYINGDNFDDLTTFIMNGGKIYGNASESGGGVAIIGNVNMTMTSGEIYDNTAEYGGGVYLGQYGKLAVATFKGNSTVYDNTASEVGGGVYNYYCIVNVEEDSVITNNTAGNETIVGAGGGVYNDEGTLSITGGTITKNEAHFGGGVCNMAGIFNMSGGKIINNAASDSGGAVYNSDLIYSWGEYYGITTLSGGVISGNTAVNDGDGFYQDATLNMNANGKVAIDNDVYLPDGRYITVNGALSYTDIGAVITPSDYILERTCVRTAYQNDISEDACANEVYFLFKLTPNNNYVLRPADFLNTESTLLSTDVVISEYYTVTYDANGGTNSPAAQIKYWTEKLSLSSIIPVRNGYKFTGWNTAKDGAGIDYIAGSEYTEDCNLMLYAQWSPIVYSIQYNLNGGNINPGNPTSYTIETDAFTLNNPTKKGYTFIGWTGSNGTTPELIVTIPKGSTGDRTYIANWKPNVYDIFYELDGGENNPDNPDEYTYGEGVDEFKEPTKPGYNFDGWYEEPEFETPIDSIGPDDEGDVTLHVKWTPITYTIKYIGNGNTGGSTPDSIHTYDSAKKLTANGYTKNGYKFVKWTTEKDGSGTAYYDMQEVINLTQKDGDIITLYAQWSPIVYSIQYNLNGGNVNPGNPTSYTIETDAFTLNNPTKKGYTFIGWTGSNGTTPELIVTIPKGSTGDRTYIANWKPNVYDIFYELDGGENNPDNPDEYTYGEGVDEFKEPTKPGYNFDGWYEEPEFETPIDSIGPDNEGDVTLHAKWTPKIYNIIYKLDGGINNPNNPDKYTYGIGVEKFFEPTKENNKFLGWYSDAELKSRINFIKSDSTGDIILYAKWDEVPEIFVEPVPDPNPEPGADDPDNQEGSVLVFYEGQCVTKEMLLENVVAMDKEDGNISDKIRIVKIEYSEGKLVNGIKQPSYTEKWDSDMPYFETLDTWFLQMDKEDSPVIHKITYEVTDSEGNTSTLEWIVKVKYNEYPEITGTNEYCFTLSEIKSGAITEKAFLEDLVSNGALLVTDKEDDIWYPGSISKKLKITDFYTEQFENMTGPGFITLHYSVIDSLGKESFFAIKIVIVVDGYLYDGSGYGLVRFVDKLNYEKNLIYSTQQLSQEKILELNRNGGLKVRSRWYLNDSFSSVILPVLELADQKDGKPLYSYYYDKSDVKEIHETFFYDNESDYNKIYELLADFIERWLVIMNEVGFTDDILNTSKFDCKRFFTHSI